MDVLLLLGKVRWNSNLLEGCNFFSSQNQTQIMKTIPSDSSPWYFLEMSKRWKVAVWEREKSVIKLFLCLRCCGIRVDVASVATKWVLRAHMSLKKRYWSTLKVHLLAFIFCMNFGNEYVSHRHMLYQNVKKGKMGFGEFFWKMINLEHFRKLE